MATRKKSGLDALADFFAEVPWWVGPIVILAAFGFVRYAVPPLLAIVFAPSDDPVLGTVNSFSLGVWTPALSLIAPSVAGLFLVVWLVSLFEKRSRRRLLENTRALEDIRALSWHQFELLVGEYYRRKGYQVEERGGSSPDGGVDVVLRKGGAITLVQCKHWKASKVSVGPVRELRGVMAHEGAARGVFVSSGRYTTDALTFAETNSIEAIDGDRLLEMVRSVQAGPHAKPVDALPGAAPRLTPDPVPTETAPQPPSCPRCGSPMVLRTARRGPNAGSQFYGCQRYPACRGIVNVALPS